MFYYETFQHAGGPDQTLEEPIGDAARVSREGDVVARIRSQQ
jgi:hypothetical protein